MTLRSRRLERRLRRAVKRALRASGTLWGDFRQVRKRGRQNLRLPAWSGRLFFLVWVGFAFGAQRRPLEVIAAVTLLWAVGMTFLRAAQLRTALYLSPALGIYKYVPISDAEVFRLQWSSFLKLGLWLAMDFTLAYAILGSQLVHASNYLVTGVLFGVLQSVLIMAGAVCLYAFVRPVFFRIAPICLVSAIALAVFGSGQTNLAKAVVYFGYWAPPVGWIFQLLGLVGAPTWFFELLPPIMAAALLALFPIAWKRSRDFYVPTEELFGVAERAVSANPVPSLQGLAEHVKKDAAEIQKDIESRSFIQPLDWNRLGLIERWMGGLLNPRQKLIAEFMLARNPQWTSGFRAFTVFLGLTLVVLFFIGRLSTFGPWVVSVSFLLRALNVVSAWRGFGLPRGSGPQSPYYALYPVGFRELMVTVMKINLLRFAIMLPLLAVCGFVFFRVLDFNWVPALLAGAKLVWVCIALQPIAALLMISSQSSDSHRASFVLGALVFIFGGLACGVLFFFPLNALLQLAAGLGLGLLSAGAFLLYERSFNRIRFDLTPVRSPASTPATKGPWG
jgi:hypothetical protein